MRANRLAVAFLVGVQSLGNSSPMYTPDKEIELNAACADFAARARLQELPKKILTDKYGSLFLASLDVSAVFGSAHTESLKLLLRQSGETPRLLPGVEYLFIVRESEGGIHVMPGAFGIIRWTDESVSFGKFTVSPPDIARKFNVEKSIRGNGVDCR